MLRRYLKKMLISRGISKPRYSASTTILVRRFLQNSQENKQFLNSRCFNLKTKYSDLFNPNLLAFAGLSLISTIAYLYLIKDYLGPRETEILHANIDLKKNSHHGYIVDSENYEYAGPKPCGELSGCIVRDKQTGKLYVKKGAKSIDALIKEFLIATFLYKVRPDVQPISLIMEKKLTDDNVRLFTLSEIHPHSMDLLEFISQEDFKQKLAMKPIVGLEEALASDFMFAKQADIKFANLIITERENDYVISTIDHEMSGKGPHAKRVFTTDINIFLTGIRDTNDLGANDNNPENYIDTSLAREFLQIAQPFMEEEKIIGLFKKTASVDMNEIISIVNDINGKDGLVDSAQGHRYIDEMNEIVKEAKHFVIEHASESNHEPVSLKKSAR